MSTQTRSQYPAVRVDHETHRMLEMLAKLDGASRTAIVARAVEHYRRERMLQQANEAWAAILSDSQTAAAAQAEDELWDETVGDGLEETAW